MPMDGEVLLQLFVFYLTVMCGALLGMYYISRSWRIVVYAILGAAHNRQIENRQLQ